MERREHEAGSRPPLVALRPLSRPRRRRAEPRLRCGRPWPYGATTYVTIRQAAARRLDRPLSVAILPPPPPGGGCSGRPVRLRPRSTHGISIVSAQLMAHRPEKSACSRLNRGRHQHPAIPARNGWDGRYRVLMRTGRRELGMLLLQRRRLSTRQRPGVSLPPATHTHSNTPGFLGRSLDWGDRSKGHAPRKRSRRQGRRPSVDFEEGEARAREQRRKKRGRESPPPTTISPNPTFPPSLSSLHVSLLQALYQGRLPQGRARPHPCRLQRPPGQEDRRDHQPCGVLLLSLSCSLAQSGF